MSNEVPQSVETTTIAAEHALPTSIRIPMIKGEMLQLRPARLEDLEVLDSIDAFYGASTITGSSKEVERAVLEAWVRDSVAWSLGDVDVEAAFEAHGRTRTIAWTMITKVQGSVDPDEFRPIGMIFLTGVDGWSHSASIQVVLGRDFRGRGYSRDAMPRVMTYGFATAPVGLNLHRISVNVPEKNTRAISVYQSLGFSIEGTLRHALWDEENEKFQDRVVMGTLVDEYDPVRALDAFGMRMNPENPGVKEALAAHEHSIEIVRDTTDGTMEVHEKRDKSEADTEAAEDSTASDKHRHSTRSKEDPVDQWPYPERGDDDSTASTSKRAWWRRIGRSRDRSDRDE